MKKSDILKNFSASETKIVSGLANYTQFLEYSESELLKDQPERLKKIFEEYRQRNAKMLLELMRIYELKHTLVTEGILKE